MRYPEFLNNNGTIGFVAPSYGCSTEPYKECFENALRRFQGMGYNTELGPNCFLGEGIGISNTPKACGEELTKYYCADTNDVLISCGGGELMCETLDYVDFEKVKNAKPKWYMGYSDNTNFTFLLTTICDTASVYGPCAASFGMEPLHESLKDALDTLAGKKSEFSGYDMWEKESFEDEEPLSPYNLTEQTKLVTVPEGKEIKMKGRLIGGCIDCLINLLGTNFDKVEDFCERYKQDGIIWFLESCDLNPMSIRRALWQMKHAGWFKYVKGFLIGRPLCFGQEMLGMDQYKAVTGALEEFGVPIVMDIDLGHLPPMIPFVCGSVADVRVSNNDINIKLDLR